MKRIFRSDKGFSVLEVVLAAALFVIFATGSARLIVQGYNANRLGAEETIAVQFSSEGIEAVKSIKNQAFTNLANNTTLGVNRSASNVWQFSGVNNTFSHNSADNYIRVLSVSGVNRDGVPPLGNIVASGGTLDPDSKKITSNVTWNFNSARPESVQLITYLSDWKKLIATTNKGGVLVYGDNAPAADEIKYRVLDPTAGTWNTAASVADVDGATTTKVARTMRLYASATRNEKILVSRHYNGASQYIYAQVYNGTSWSNVNLLSSWAATTFLDVRNFDGTYLQNGDFMVVYSDNTTTPKFKTWNGTAWSTASGVAGTATQIVGGIPNYIVASARPATNEVMVVTFDQLNDTNSEYFNGTTYVTASWTLHTEHSAVAPTNTKQHVDFAWSPNTTTTGALVYTDSATDKALTVKIWVANGTGGGAWGTAVNAATAQTNNFGAVQVIARKGANEFHACDKDAGATPTIICRKFTFSGTVPAISNPTNPTIASATDTGIQRSFDIEFEGSTGTDGLAVYSDNTDVPKLKKYAPGTSTWDATATNISTTPFTLGVVKTVRMTPRTDSDDIMAFMADANLDIYSVAWDGTNNVMYTTPSGKAFSQHGLNGSATTDFWYDFAWDKF